MKKLLPLVALVLLQPFAAAPPALAQASAAQAAGKTKPSPLAPGEIVAAAPKADWTAVATSDLLVMELAADAKGKPRRVVIQLIPPPFSQGWVGNIRKLAKAHWWDGLSINRVQDNYVVQWGDANADDKVKAKSLPVGLKVMPESEYNLTVQQFMSLRYTSFDPWNLNLEAEAGGKRQPENSGKEPQTIDELAGLADARLKAIGSAIVRAREGDSYAPAVEFANGFPVAQTLDPQTGPDAWPVHCYGMVGVGRDLSPNTGTGAELYVVIGHAPRHLDRNIALVGRVIEGIEFLSSLPRGHGALGFYDLEQGDERTGIVSIHPGVEVKDLPAYEYLSTESTSFAKYADARANRRDAFFIRPAGGADVCNIPIPVRRVKG